MTAADLKGVSLPAYQTEPRQRNPVRDRPLCAVIVGRVRLSNEALACVLTSSAAFSDLGTATSLSEACERIRELAPDVILLDASTPALLAILPALRTAPSTQVLAFGVDEAESAIACAEAGASAFVGQDATVDELVSAVVRCSNGEFAISSGVATALYNRVAELARSAGRRAPLGSELTRREREVFRLLAKGMSNKQISDTLGIRVTTVKNHVHHVLEKLGVHSRTQAAVLTSGRSGFEKTLS